MADPDRAVFDADEAAGRRRRGLIIVAVIAVVGIPLTLLDWWSTRQVEQAAAEVVADLRSAAMEIDDPAGVFQAEIVAGWGDDASDLDALLGHREQRRAAAAVDGGVAAAYEVRYWLETRCVHLVVTTDEVRTDVEDTTRCGV